MTMTAETTAISMTERAAKRIASVLASEPCRLHAADRGGRGRLLRLSIPL